MTDTKDGDNFDRLLAALPDVSAAFTDPAVQLKAIEALSNALGRGSPEAPASPTGAQLPLERSTLQPADQPTDPLPKRNKPTKNSSGSKSNSTKKDWTVTKGLNFAPNGDISLKEFAEQKCPKNQEEKNVLACYYLATMMEHSPIKIGDVMAVYQALSWPKPQDPDNSLQRTASRKGWIDTKNMSAIEVVWAGKNHVEENMPTRSSGK